MARAKLRIDQGKLEAVVAPMTQKALLKAGRATRDRARANIIRADRMRTGEMGKRMRVEPISGQSRMHPKVVVGTPVSYAKFQEFGTRAHGPVRAKFLVFTPKGSTKRVFAKWVRGVRPARFMKQALDALRPTDFEL